MTDETIRCLRLGREEARETAAATTSTLRFAATHTLSTTFFPVWLRALQERAKLDIAVLLTADNMQACEKLMLQGQVQFLLCHYHPAAATVLDPTHFQSLTLGEDVLLPVSAPTEDGREASYALPGTPERPLPHLTYGVESGVGRILAATRAVEGPPVYLTPSLVQPDLALGSLERAGNETWDIPIEIRLYRSRARQAATAEAFWSLVSE